MSDTPGLEYENDFIPIDQQEEENDLQTGITYQDIVIMNTDWTVETLQSQINKGNIDLEPTFQRRSAWDNVRKSRLIESILVGLPVPNIVVAEKKGQKGRFFVIDGKQRLLSISEFFQGSLRLSGLDIRPDLNGKVVGELESSDREGLENSTLRSSLVKNWRDDRFLYVVFYRLNSGSLQLSPQELRKALVGSKLIDEIELYLAQSNAFHSVFGLILDRRMRDSELVIRYVAFDRAYEHYEGNLKTFLDKVTSDFEDGQSFPTTELKSRLERLDTALDTTFQIFGSDSFKKWLGDKYERRMNRAVFDALTRFFAETALSVWALNNKSEVVEAFKELCLAQEFKDSIERTTKSRTATTTRIAMWGQKMAQLANKAYEDSTGRVV